MPRRRYSTQTPSHPHNNLPPIYRSSIVLFLGRAAVELDPANHVLFSNRASAHALLHDFESSRRDAAECVRLEPNFLKGHLRLASAHVQLQDFAAAETAIAAADALDSAHADVTRLKKLLQKKRASGGTADAGAEQKKASVKDFEIGKVRPVNGRAKHFPT